MRSVPLERRGDYVVKMYELDEGACRQMLARCTFGRVAFVDAVDGLSVLPVNCLYSHDAVLFRTQPGSVLDQLGEGRPVAFETDHIDPVARSGWSVLVRGMATHLRDPARIAALADSTVQPWAPGQRDRWVEIDVEQVTGRIIRRHRLAGEDGPRPKMAPD
jgi:nitroimidazol reductase NimA-like FMN-containing flavoprotein (pyridoxamine 5'-phosphate oxidase superfamily)